MVCKVGLAVMWFAVKQFGGVAAGLCHTGLIALKRDRPVNAGSICGPPT